MKAEPTPGSQSLLTPELQATILRARRQGLGILLSAAAAGVSTATLRNWLRYGRQHVQEGVESEFSRLAEAWGQATAVRAVEALERIEAAGKGNVMEERVEDAPLQPTAVGNRTAEGMLATRVRYKGADWKADAWWLQNVARVAKPKAVEVSGPGGGPLKITTLAALAEAAATAPPADPEDTDGGAGDGDE